jgi:hypothetical protein
MTAPAADHDRMWQGWSDWIDGLIKVELFRAHWHQRIWTEVRDEMQRHMDPGEDASFLVSYSQLYGQAQLMRIRRLTDPDSRSASLRVLIEAIGANRDLVTVDRHVRNRTDPEEARREWIRDYADEAGRLRPGPLVHHLEQLDDLDHLKVHIDKQIAHLDRSVALGDSHDAARARPPAVPVVRYQDVRSALDVLGDVANFYLALLTGSSIGDWTPIMLDDWHGPLRNGLFRPE